MTKLLKNNLAAAVFLSVIFFVAEVSTLTGYGINWDTINHLPRGQVYLHYFLRGKRDFYDLPKYRNYWQKPEELSPDASLLSQRGPLRSYYENEAFNFDWFLETDGAGHPPLSDILSSAFNKILFGNLRIINDIDSYRIYGVLLSSALVGLVFFWTTEIFGVTSGFFAALSLALYPLFWSESHFNTEKDVPEASFIMFFLYCLWKGFTKKDWKWIAASGIFFGLGLGTKFNILFSVFVIVPWLFVYLRKKVFGKENLKLLFVGFIAFLEGIAIFYLSWPFLWQDQDIGIMKVIGFYKSIGTTSSIDSRFLGPLGVNTFPSLWILYTTPILILIFTTIGIWVAMTSFKKDKSFTGLIFILSFLLPIFRVSVPHANIYGGVRQIMEYIPGMAILSGMGAGSIIQRLKKVTAIGVRNFPVFDLSFCILIFAFLLYPIIKYHPNENVYFNFLTGGLSGAKERNFPSWGNSFGSAYRQGVVWLNENAPKDSTVVLAYELIPNIPRIWIRPDLNLSNGERSGPAKSGEFAVTLTYEGTSERSFYDSYLERELNPVFEIKADGVPILKIWKNDREHTKKEFLEERELKDFKLGETEKGFFIDIGDIRRLSRLEAKFQVDTSCKNLSFAFSEISNDGKFWRRLPGTMPKEDWNTSAFGEQPEKNSFIQPFAGDETRFVRYVVFPNDACFKRITSIKVFEYK